MISLIIVDDEMTIRKGLSKEFDWSLYDIELVGEASNGEDGISLALMVKPDIIITDIKMPIMSGLDMSKILFEKLPKTKIIFLTGYSDFQYAKTALSVKAVEYLLKPVNFDELANVIEDVCKQIKVQKDKQEKRDNEEKYFLQALPYLRARLFTDFANETINYYDFYEKAIELKIPVNGINYSVGLIQFDDLMRNLELSSISNRNSCDLIIKKTINLELSNLTEFCIAYFDTKLFVLVSSDNNENDVNNFWNILKKNIYNQLKATVSIGISKFFSDAALIGKSIHEAAAALEIGIQSNKNQVVNFKGNLTHIIPILSINLIEEKAFIEQIHNGNKTELLNTIDKILNKYIFMKPYMPKRSVEQFCISLIRLVVREATQFGIELKDLIGENRNLYVELSNLQTMNDLQDWINELFLTMSNSLRDKESKVPPTIISVSMAYARENYSKAISVSEIAERMKVTANYFSRLFKKWNGVNFVEWLNSYRIEEAKKQLVNEPDKKIYEIAFDTGFNDYKYFAFIFKKYNGCTPQSFRDLRVGCETKTYKGVDKLYE